MPDPQRRPPQYPLTADLAGVLAVARRDRAEDIGLLFAWLLRAGRRARQRLADKPLDSAAIVR